MSTVQDIESAIRALSPEERDQLARVLPALLSELDGDAAWERINRDTRPRPAFSALVDKLEADFQGHPNAFPEIKDSEFDRRS